MTDFSLVAIAGPTSDQQPPFIWSQLHCDKKKYRILVIQINGILNHLYQHGYYHKLIS